MQHGTNVDVVLESLAIGYSPEDWRHYRSVESLCARVAQSMGWLPEEIEDLKLAAVFHHVDTARVPESALSPKVADYLHEFQMRTMSCIWDRPMSRGGRVEEAASIIAMADRFDRLTSTQRYRAAFSENDALDMMKYDAESPVDELVVATFTRLYETEPYVRLAKAA